MRLTRGRDDGSSASIGIAISTALMAGAFVMANLMVAKPPGLDNRASQYEAVAETALEVIVRDQGSSTSMGAAWALDADKLTRFGLALPDQPNFIDYQKIKALRNGTLSTVLDNKAPDYPEVKEAIAIRSTDFHLRTYPVLPGLDDPRWSKIPTGRYAYFAHYSGAAAPVNITAATSKDSDTLNVTLLLRNVGTRDAVFTAAVSLGSPLGGATVTEERHTRLLAPGASTTVWVNFNALDDWNDDFGAVHVVVTDSYGNIAIDASGAQVGDFWLAQTPPENNAHDYNIVATAGSPYYVSGQTVKFNVDHYVGDGGHANNARARFVLLAPSGATIVNQTIDLPQQKNQVYTYSCTTCTAVGNYTAIAWDTTMQHRSIDVVHVSADQMFTEKNTLAPIALTEMGQLTSLVKTFNATRYDADTNPNGDVFGDDANGPNDIASFLSRYTTLVIGSEVTQTALNAATTKYAIRDWVQAGGNLIVLGTKNQQSRWLEPIYHAAQVNANGGISAPDPTHPVLVTPNRLSYDRYLDRGRAWDIEKDQPFTHVLTRGTTGNSVQDTLVVSNPGTIGNGTVVLTSYMPGSLTDPQDDQEGRKLLQNLMSQSYTMLFLDYGPPIPDSVPVGSSSRLVAVPHPNVPGAVVEVRLVMYVFG